MAPANTSPPTISGTAQQGQTLTATSGSWSGTTPLAYTYQWQRCNSAGSSCAAIGGATSSTQALVAADVGSTMRVLVTATNTAGSAQGTSAATAVVTALTPPANTAAPQLSGTVRLGQTLTVSTGSWSGSPAPTYGYQWQRCDAGGGNCASIAGATAQTYAVVAADVGGHLLAVVTATNSAGSASQASSQTGSVTSLPAATAPPTVSGTPLVGQTLTAAPGTWSGTPTPTLAYQWQSCDSTGSNCLAIPGATRPDYVLVASDASRRLSVIVAATNSEGSASAISARTAAIAPLVAPLNTAHPTIAGTRVVGQSLTASPQTWRGTPPLTFSYQWQRCSFTGTGCTDIPGATGQSYLLAPGDYNGRIQVVVAGANAAGRSTHLSGQTGVIASPPLNTAQPTLFGTPRSGQLLYLGTGMWQGTAPITYAYQWQRCDATGNGCADIPGATNQSYAPTVADAGGRLRAIVTAKNDLGAAAQPTPVSTVAEAVPSAPRSTTAPAIAGAPLVGSLLHVDGGTWSGFPSPTLTFRWQRCDATGSGCADIPAAQGADYRVRTGDVRYPLRAVVTAVNSAGSFTAFSAPTAPTAAGGVQRVEVGGQVVQLRPSKARIRFVLFELRGRQATSLWLELDTLHGKSWRRTARQRVALGARATTKLLSFAALPAAKGAARISVRWQTARAAAKTSVYVGRASSLRAA